MEWRNYLFEKPLKFGRTRSHLTKEESKLYFKNRINLFEDNGMLHIVYSPGAFGHHVGWLLWLDDSFQNIWLANQEYQTIWSDKVEYILDYVYPLNRTWYNWISYENSWRIIEKDILNNTFKCHHELEGINETSPVLLLTCDVELVYKSYLKFGIDWVANTREDVFKRIQEYNDFAENNFIKTTENTTIDTTCLYNSVLNRDWYEKLTQFYMLDDNYDKAKIIHKRWFNLQKTAEQEFLKEVKETYE